MGEANTPSAICLQMGKSKHSLRHFTRCSKQALPLWCLQVAVALNIYPLKRTIKASIKSGPSIFGEMCDRLQQLMMEGCGEEGVQSFVKRPREEPLCGDTFWQAEELPREAKLDLFTSPMWQHNTHPPHGVPFSFDSKFSAKLDNKT